MPILCLYMFYRCRSISYGSILYLGGWSNIARGGGDVAGMSMDFEMEWPVGSKLELPLLLVVGSLPIKLEK